MLKAIGLMSGTSLDGVDVALIETNGERVAAFGPTSYRAYSDAERKLLRQALADAKPMIARDSRTSVLAEAEALVTRAHAEAVLQFIQEHGLRRDEMGVVGFHGQTVLHRPEDRLTVQIGDGRGLANSIAMPVVFDMRAADVAAGGQGAPLVPIYHRALVEQVRLQEPTVVVNIGGVANITYIDGDTLIACDTGPGNALLDDLMLRATGAAMDRDGLKAAGGKQQSDWLARALNHPFFREPPPKSLDRNAFAALSVDGMSVEDGAATLTALTAKSIAAISLLLPQAPGNWIVVGGGARNPTLLRMLANEIAPATVMRGEDLGWTSDAIEAQAFAYLAVRSLNGLPLTFPGTTGAPSAMTGGVLVRPD